MNPQAPARRRALLIAATASTGAWLTGCVVAPYDPYGGYGRGGYEPEYGPEVATAPPSPYYESPPPSPGAAYVWIGGYWTWRLGRYAWIGGRWSLPPAGYRRWVPGHWGPHGRGYRYRGGYWSRR